ncbi:unnamed protein product, partial [Mesorhabditis belari]|uniref:F-box domain-containing protein n=1 Tax=Mesorhabditis belari TaxID=2138241 RepID=A0AAF3FJH7_9BILA
MLPHFLPIIILHMSTSSFNFFEELPDVVFYAVLERLPGRVIENTVRLISRDCYRRVELRRGRLPRVYLDQLIIRAGSRFEYRREPFERARPYCDFAETIDPADLVQHLNHLKERATFKTLELMDVNWAYAANCKLQIECEELSCCGSFTTLSPERFMHIFCSIRPTRKLTIKANQDNDIFPVTSDFFTNNYAIRLQEVSFCGYGNAMVDPLNDTILLYSNFPIFYNYFPTSPGCTLDGILTGCSETAAGGQAERQNFLRNLSGLLVDKMFYDKSTAILGSK